MEFGSVSAVAQIEDHIASLSFQDAEGSYVIVSRALVPSCLDQKLVHDKVYVEVNDQLKSTYGGILEATLAPTNLKIIFNDRSSGNVGTVAIAISFKTDAQLWSHIKRVADSVFANERNYKTEA